MGSYDMDFYINTCLASNSFKSDSKQLKFGRNKLIAKELKIIKILIESIDYIIGSN